MFVINDFTVACRSTRLTYRYPCSCRKIRKENNNAATVMRELKKSL